MATHSLEERLTALEAEVAQLKRQLNQQKEESCVPWWERISGAFANDPMFDEAMRLGREWREAQRMDYEDEDTDAVENANGAA
jgi:hypothetical protein